MDLSDPLLIFKNTVYLFINFVILFSNGAILTDTWRWCSGWEMILMEDPAFAVGGGGAATWRAVRGCCRSRLRRLFE